MAQPAQSKNFVDRAIEAIAPDWAARRYAARAQIEMARSVQSSYRGAMATRDSTPWSQSTSFRGGSTRDRHELGAMRDRGRRAYRENVIARSLLNTETDNVIAEGFTLQMKTGDPEFNKEAEDRFYKWMERADVTGKASAGEMFRASWREPRKDGDGGFVLTTIGGYPRLQYIPGDLIINPRASYDPRTMFNGVECDPSGRPVRYWVRDVDENGKDTVSPVDARDFVYLSHADDPLAVRGRTVYGSVFTQLDQLDTYVDSLTKASIMGCIFGLVEKRNKPASVTGPLGMLQNSQGQMQKAVTLEGGMLKVLGTDESIFQVNAQQPMVGSADHIRAMFRLICLAFDMPLEIGSRDLSQVNFSGGRIGLIAFYRSCRVKQDWILSRCWNRIVTWWLSKERQRQQLGYADAFAAAFPEDYAEFELHGREWDYNDPVTEAQGDLLEWSMGATSPQQIAAKRGRDWEDIQKQIEVARSLLKEKEIPIVLSSFTRDEIKKTETIDANSQAGGAGTQPPPQST